MRSVPGLELTLRSVGGDKAVGGMKRKLFQETGSGLTSFQRVQRIRTRGDVPDDGVSTVASVVDGLNAVGVLCPRYQARNVNDS